MPNEIVARGNEKVVGATWFLYHAETGEPLGQILRGSPFVPAVGEMFEAPVKEPKQFQIVRFEELAYACEMRRYKVWVTLIAKH